MMNLDEMMLSVRSNVRAAARWQNHHELAKGSVEQKKRFCALRSQFRSRLEALEKFDISHYTTPNWKNFNEKVRAALFPEPSFAFLRNPTVMYTMFLSRGGTAMKTELDYLESKLKPEELQRLLAEDGTGAPLLLNSRYRTSHNTIHHLHHLIRFQERTGRALNSISSVIEWGGGYGNLAKLFTRLVGKQRTYTIIDTPLFSCLQWLYLSTIFGEENVNLIQSPQQTIQEGKINLVPVCFIPNLSLQAELFISTWALNESSVASQDAVTQRNWFGAKHLLLAYLENYPGLPDSERVAKAAVARGASIEDIEFLPKNHYVFL